MEASLTKARILEIYLNVIEWGDRIYGAEAASRTYFHKPASALTADEAALLAACIVNPRIWNPARPTPGLVRRQKLILGRMGIVTPPPDPPTPPAADEPAKIEEPIKTEPPPPEKIIK
jgi:monofunctional biosynthetic peptidoglycan transglycosylase